MEPLPVEFHPAAIEDARTAREWYEERNADVALAFMRELDEAIDQVANYPDRWAKFLHGTRHFLFRRFPYVVVYRRFSDTIQIVAVAHAKRKPGYWSDRVDTD